MDDQAFEKMLSITIQKKMQIKTTMSYYLTPIKMAIIEKKHQVLVRMYRKGNACALLIEM